MTEVTTRGPGRLPGSTIKRLSAVIRARYGLHNDLPLDVLLATMEYWAAQCAKLVDREAEAATTVDAATGKVIRAEPDTKLAADIRYAFEMLGWYSEKCAPYFHPKVKPVELGGTIELRRLSYDDLRGREPLRS